MKRFWDGQTDGVGVTALLDLLSPSATQVKIPNLKNVGLEKLSRQIEYLVKTSLG